MLTIHPAVIAQAERFAKVAHPIFNKHNWSWWDSGDCTPTEESILKVTNENLQAALENLEKYSTREFTNVSSGRIHICMYRPRNGAEEVYDVDITLDILSH
jgi:hypothetical protein